MSMFGDKVGAIVELLSDEEKRGHQVKQAGTLVAEAHKVLSRTADVALSLLETSSPNAST